MSIKELIKDPSVWMLPISNIITWYLSKPKKKIELQDTRENVLNKVSEYDTKKIETLLDRVIESDKVIEQLMKQIDDMGRTLQAALTENKQIRAELNLYKTIN